MQKNMLPVSQINNRTKRSIEIIYHLYEKLFSPCGNKKVGIEVPAFFSWYGFYEMNL